MGLRFTLLQQKCNNYLMASDAISRMGAKLAAYAGAICAVHCVLTGLALGLLSVVGLGFLANPAVEASFLSIAVILGLWALWHGVSRHHSWAPALVFVAGLGFIAAAHFLFGRGLHEGDPWAVACAALGGLLIGAFQLVNLKMQHRGCGHECGRTGHDDRARAA
jgi:hypothetical protein